MSDQPIIEAIGVCKTFKDFWRRPKAKAVNDLDFTLHRGEVFGLLGPNGSGKSTTVKMLLGLLYPTAGILTVYGKSPRHVETKKQIGYLPEETTLYPYLTAEETLNFFGAIFNLSKEERQKRTTQLLEMVGLTHVRHRCVGEFSKGMARRIGIAQALINDPELLILDEPTSGLDPIGTHEIKELIQTLKKNGKTLLITGHLLADIEEVCDRIAILYGGKIRVQGKLEQLLELRHEQNIQIPDLPPEVITQVMSILQKAAMAQNSEVYLSPVKCSLEHLFLEVVKNAQKESDSFTDGAVSNGKMADYLITSTQLKPDLSHLVNSPSPMNQEIANIEETPSLSSPSSFVNVNLQNLTEQSLSDQPDQSLQKAQLEAANQKLDAFTLKK